MHPAVATALEMVRSEYATSYRRITGVPNWLHNLRCLEAVAAYGGDPSAQQVAVLHDVLRYGTYPVHHLTRVFGADVMGTVNRVTVFGDSPWLQRRSALLRRVAEFGPTELTVVLVDRTDDLRSFVQENGDFVDSPSYWSHFHAGWADQLWFHQELARAVVAGQDRFIGARDVLRTEDALQAYLQALEVFRDGSLWTPDGVVTDTTRTPYLARNQGVHYRDEDTHGRDERDGTRDAGRDAGRLCPCTTGAGV